MHNGLSCRVDDVEGLESLRWEDQQKIRKYVEDAVGSNSIPAAPQNVECGVETSPTARATCRCCNQKIAKGEVRCLRLNFVKNEDENCVAFICSMFLTL